MGLEVRRGLRVLVLRLVLRPGLGLLVWCLEEVVLQVLDWLGQVLLVQLLFLQLALYQTDYQQQVASQMERQYLVQLVALCHLQEVLLGSGSLVQVLVEALVLVQVVLVLVEVEVEVEVAGLCLAQRHPQAAILVRVAHLQGVLLGLVELVEVALVRVGGELQ